MAEVATHVQAEVTSDGARGGVRGLGSAQELATLGKGVKALEHHRYNGTSQHEVDQTVEEGLALQVGVVLFKVLTRRSDHLKRFKLKALLFESN